jgi:hypothetical protein
LLLAICSGTSWYFLHKPVLTIDDLAVASEVVANGPNWTGDGVERHLEEQGLTVRAPARFKYRYLQQVDVVEIRGRRVARLTFRNDDQSASATVFIIDSTQFNVGHLRNQSGIEVRPGEGHQAGFTYVIHWVGNLLSLENDVN